MDSGSSRVKVSQRTPETRAEGAGEVGLLELSLQIGGLVLADVPLPRW